MSEDPYDDEPRFVDDFEDESEPPVEDDVDDPEEVLEDFIAATRERWEPEDTTPPPRETVPPPESQSGFVNPALARIAAVRSPVRQKEASEIWLALRTIFIVMLAGLVISFIFSYWTPEGFLSQEFIANLQEVSSTQGPPTPIPSPPADFRQRAIRWNHLRAQRPPVESAVFS